MSHFPLVLPHPEVRRILQRRASRLILTRQVKPGTFEVQDALVVRRNERYRKSGRADQQETPGVFSITITAVHEVTLLELDLAIVRASGFKTQRDFFDDWLERRRHIDPEQTVRVCAFAFVEEARFLHRRVHRGYTTDPRLAVLGEPEALSKDELNDLAAAATRRFEREHAEELLRRRMLAARARRREAERAGNVVELRAANREIERLIAERGRAA